MRSVLCKILSLRKSFPKFHMYVLKVTDEFKSWAFFSEMPIPDEEVFNKVDFVEASGGCSRPCMHSSFKSSLGWPRFGSNKFLVLAKLWFLQGSMCAFEATMRIYNYMGGNYKICGIAQDIVLATARSL